MFRPSHMLEEARIRAEDSDRVVHAIVGFAKVVLYISLAVLALTAAKGLL